MSVALLCCPASWAGDAPADSDPAAKATTGYEISWWSAHGSGGTSTGGPYVLEVHVGAPVTGTSESGDGGYVLLSGFAVVRVSAEGVLFSDGFESGDCSSWSVAVGL